MKWTRQRCHVQLNTLDTAAWIVHRTGYACTAGTLLSFPAGVVAAAVAFDRLH